MYSIENLSSSSSSHPVPVIQVDPAWAQRTLGTVQCGFPSPEEDHAIERVDLNKVLIKHPQATFLMRVRGDSMREACLDGPVAVLVDRVVDDNYPGRRVASRRNVTRRVVVVPGSVLNLR